MSTVTRTTRIEAIGLEVDDPDSARGFYDAAFGLGSELAPRPLVAGAEPSGFRGYTLSAVVANPATVDGFMCSAVSAGGTEIKPAAKSLWGYGGSVRAPDGAIWTIATSAKKDTGPATRQIDSLVLVLATSDLAASRGFYADQGLTVAKSFPRAYVQFDAAGGTFALALNTRKGLAKNAGVAPAGSGPHRLVVLGDGAEFTDPDGFAWERAADR